MNPDASKGESQLPNALDQRSLQGATMPPEQATQAQNIQMPGGPNLAQPQGAQMHGVQLQGVQEQGMPGVAMPNLADGQSMQGAASNTAMPGQNAQQSVMGQSAMGQPVMGQPAMNPQGINQPVANMSMANRALDPQMVAHMQQQERIRKQGNRKKFKKVVLVMLLVLILAAAVAGGVWALMTQPWKSDSKTSNDDTSANVEDKDQSSGQDVPGGQVANDPDCATEVAYIPEFVTEEMYEQYKRNGEAMYEALSMQAQELRGMGMEDDARQNEEILEAYRKDLERSFEEYRNAYLVRKATGSYICLQDWNVKIKIPEDLSNVEYMIMKTPGGADQLAIVGATVDNKRVSLNDYAKLGSTRQFFMLADVYWVDFANARNECGYVYCYHGGLKRLSDEELSYFKQMAVYENGDYGVMPDSIKRGELLLNALATFGLPDDEEEAIRKIINLTTEMLTNRENYSAL